MVGQGDVYYVSSPVSMKLLLYSVLLLCCVYVMAGFESVTHCISDLMQIDPIQNQLIGFKGS